MTLLTCGNIYKVMLSNSVWTYSQRSACIHNTTIMTGQFASAVLEQLSTKAWEQCAHKSTCIRTMSIRLSQQLLFLLWGDRDSKVVNVLLQHVDDEESSQHHCLCDDVLVGHAGNVHANEDVGNGQCQCCSTQCPMSDVPVPPQLPSLLWPHCYA